MSTANCADYNHSGFREIIPHCGNEIHMNLDILFELMNNMFKCEECGFKIESSNYVYDYEGEADAIED